MRTRLGDQEPEPALPPLREPEPEPLLLPPVPELPGLELSGLGVFDEPSPELSRLVPELPLEGELPPPTEDDGAGTPNAAAVLLSKVPVTVMFCDF